MEEIKTWNSVAIGDDALLNIRSVIDNSGEEIVKIQVIQVLL